MHELNRLSTDEFKKTEKIPVTVVLDNIRSLNNIGSVFRTSDAFLIKKICLCGICATPPHNDIHKTALGAEQSVDWEYFKNTPDCIIKLKKQNNIIIAVEQTDESIKINDFQPNVNNNYTIIFGHEVNGIDQKVLDLCDLSIEVPQHGTKHSLNISVCAGIVLWEFSKIFNQ